MSIAHDGDTQIQEKNWRCNNFEILDLLVYGIFTKSKAFKNNGANQLLTECHIIGALNWCWSKSFSVYLKYYRIILYVIHLQLLRFSNSGKTLLKESTRYVLPNIILNWFKVEMPIALQKIIRIKVYNNIFV